MDDFFDVGSLPISTGDNQSTVLENDLLHSADFFSVSETPQNDREGKLLGGFGLGSINDKPPANAQPGAVKQSVTDESRPESFDILSLGDVQTDDWVAANTNTSIRQGTFSPDSFDVLSFEGDMTRTNDLDALPGDKHEFNFEAGNAKESSAGSQTLADIHSIFSPRQIQQAKAPTENVVAVTVKAPSDYSELSRPGQFNDKLNSGETDVRVRTGIKGPINQDIYAIVDKDARKDQRRDDGPISITSTEAVSQLSCHDTNQYIAMSVGSQSGSLSFATLDQQVDNQGLTTTLDSSDRFQQTSTPANSPTLVVNQETVADNAMGAVDQFLEEFERKKFEPGKDHPYLDLDDVIAKSTTTMTPATIDTNGNSNAPTGGLKKSKKASSAKKKVSFAGVPEDLKPGKKLRSPDPINQQNSGGPRITMPEFSDAWDFNEVDDGKSDFIPTTNLE